MEVIRHGNEKLQSKEQKIKVKKQRKLKGDLSWIHKKKYLKEHGNKKPVTNDTGKLKTRANETEYRSIMIIVISTTNNKID